MELQGFQLYPLLQTLFSFDDDRLLLNYVFPMSRLLFLLLLLLMRLLLMLVSVQFLLSLLLRLPLLCV